jgi:transcriptional regulator with XRE-family HTH domain
VAERDKLLVQIGMRIRSLRETKGVSQEGLAEKSGLHRTYIGGVERGLRNPSVKSLARMAKALGVGIVQLFEAEKS